MTERTCGTCGHWSGPQCTCPLPMYIPDDIFPALFDGGDATDCECFKCKRCKGTEKIWIQEGDPNMEPAKGQPCPVCQPQGDPVVAKSATTAKGCGGTGYVCLLCGTATEIIDEFCTIKCLACKTEFTLSPTLRRELACPGCDDCRRKE